jgi:hypothetical protein
MPINRLLVKSVFQPDEVQVMGFSRRPAPRLDYHIGTNLSGTCGD